jgi:hypothetical protein
VEAILMIVALLSWVFIIIEFISEHLFVGYIFKIGIPIIRRIDNIPISIIQVGNIYNCDEGKFKFISEHECLFLSRYKFFNLLRIHTPFPVRGRAKWNPVKGSSYVEIKGQIPLGTTIFTSTFLIACIIGGIHNGAFVFLLILLVVGALLLLEISRFDTMVKELRQLVSREGLRTSAPPKVVND